MSNTVSQAFNRFANAIDPSAGQKRAVTERFERAQQFLSNAFPPSSALPLKQVHLMGSTKRGTAIQPVTDLDVLAVFTNKENIYEQYRWDSQSFLYRVRDAINKKTTVKQVGSRGQAVRLEYTDGLHVDIVPAFKYSDGGFGIPAGDRSWRTTDPLVQNDWTARRQRDLDGLFCRRVRFLKAWNRAHSSRLGSWHLEVLVGEVFVSMSKDSRGGLQKFFEWARSRLVVADPDGHGDLLGSSLSANQLAAVEHAMESAHARAIRAIAAAHDGDHAEAIRLWKIVLGDQFGR